jgi:multiple sugar transport system substrate-binding protein
MRLKAVLLASLLLAAAGLVGCGDPKTGPIYFAAGPDVPLRQPIQRLVVEWNKLHRDQQVTFLPLSPEADDTHSQLLANSQDPDQNCYDVMALDVVWTKEFADGGYLVELPNEDVGLPGSPQELRTVYGSDDKTWGVPFTSNVGILYYRKDLLGGKKPSGQWQDILDAATMKYEPKEGYEGQFGAYEGLIVNFFERAWDHMGVGNADRPNIQAITNALQDLANAFENENIPGDALEHDERASVNDFIAGRVKVMRNWPNWISELQSNPELKDKWDWMPMPWKSALGGLDLVESRCAKHQKTATDFIKVMTSASAESRLGADGYIPARDVPESADYRDIVRNAVKRPALDNYTTVSQRIKALVHGILDKCVPSKSKPDPDCGPEISAVANQIDHALSAG